MPVSDSASLIDTTHHFGVLRVVEHVQLKQPDLFLAELFKVVGDAFNGNLSVIRSCPST